MRGSKIILKILKWFVLSIFSVVLILIVLAYVFEKKIKRYAINYINQYLTTELKVDEISFSFIKKFPEATLDFKNVLILDPPGINRDKDTLLYAKNIYLQFNIWDVFMSEYDVKKIEMNTAKIDIYTDYKNNENFRIWKEDTSEIKNNKFAVDLEKVTFIKSDISYRNVPEKKAIHAQLKKLNFSGKFSEDKFNLNISGNKIKLKHLESDNFQINKKHEIDLVLELEVDKVGHNISIIKSSLIYEKMKFICDGKAGFDNNNYLYLNISGDNINLQEIIESLPEEIIPQRSNYSAKGIAQVNLKFERSNSENLKIDISFNLSQASITEKKSNLTLKKINLIGFYNNHDKNGGSLVLNKVTGELDESYFDISAKIHELQSPKISSKILAKINLETFYTFFNTEAIKKAKGIVDCNFNMELSYNNTHDEFELKNADGTLQIENVEIQSNLYKHSLEKCSGIFRLKNSHAAIDDFKTQIASSNIQLNGVIQNFLSYLLGIEDKMNIVAEIESDNINLNELLETHPDNLNQHGSLNLALPQNINMNVRLKIKQLIKKEFMASNINLHMILLDKKVNIKEFNADYADGRINGSLEIDGTFENLFGFTSDVKLKNVNSREVFRQFEDFGQNSANPFISHKNINGKISMDASLGGLIDSELNIEKNKFYFNADVILENGELIKLPSMLDIGDYLKNDKKTKLALGNKNIEELEKKLQHIKFNTLSNHIEIKDGTVYIPKMDIASNLINIKLSGTHTFNNDIDYRFNFRFNDLKKQNQQTEYGYIIDDGTGIKIYVRMFGKTDSPNFELDKSSIKEDFSEYNKQELKNIKAILKNELGLFKKDTNAVLKQTPKEQVKFILEDDDNLKESHKLNEPEITKPDNKKKMQKFKQKLGIEEEKSKIKTTIEN